MTQLFTVLLTILLVLDCLFLILLVLVQLPKKEAGAGLAFGGAATDALFGAGSGTALTKITKYAAGVFFALAIILAMLSGKQKGASLEEKLKERSGKTAMPNAPMTPSPSSQSTAPATTPGGIPVAPVTAPTEQPANSTPLITTPPATTPPAPNVPAATSTNAPAPK